MSSIFSSSKGYILATLLYHGLRREELCKLRMRDLQQREGVLHFRVHGKGDKTRYIPVGLKAQRLITEYLEDAKHGDDIEGPLFRPVRENQNAKESRRHLAPIAIDRVLRKYARSIGLERGYSAHSMRATFITTALDNGASLEDVQSAAGHADPSTAKLYDRRGYNPEKSASFFANY